MLMYLIMSAGYVSCLLTCLQVCGAGNLMERAGHRPVSVRCVSAGPELFGRRLSAPLPAVWLSDSCCRSRGRALRLPGDAC